MTIVALTDLRSVHGSARQQGDRPTCLAFTLSDLNMHRHGRTTPFSPEYLYREAARKIAGWRSGDGLQLDAALKAVNAPGQPLEVDCPYSRDEPTAPPDPNGPQSRLFANSFPHMIPDHQQIVSALQRGRSVGLVLRVTPEFIDVEMPSGQVTYSVGVLPGALHAVLAVGHGIDSQTDEMHLLIRNSWGAGWGLQGHAWVPERYIAKHGLSAFGA